MSEQHSDPVLSDRFSAILKVIEANDTSRDRDEVTPRRSFLRSAASLAAVPALVAVTASQSHAASGSIPSLYPGWNARNFKEIQNDEDHHVVFLQTVITSLGGIPRPQPTFKNLKPPTIQAFIMLSQAFENTGVGAYQAAAPLIYNPGVLIGAADIAFVEAYHSGYLNTLLNTPIVPGGSPFSFALSVPEIVSRVSPYIASLNGGPDPSSELSATPSPQNDLAILNFALLLEFLEKQYYDINVPRFFP